MLFKQRKFVELLDHIEYNQNKINKKKDRQNKNLDKFLSTQRVQSGKVSQQQLNINHQDNKQEEKDEVLVVTSGNNINNRLNNGINSNNNNNNNNPKSINTANNRPKFKSMVHINNQIMDNKFSFSL